MISVTIPIRLVSEMNAREHWAKKASRVRSQRAIVTMKLRTCALTPAWLLSNPAKMTASVLDSTMHEVTLTRIAPRPFDLHDNLRSSFKACVDSVASFLGLDDRDPRVRWSYAQEKGAPRYYAVRIEVRAVETDPAVWAEVLATVEKRRKAAEKRAAAQAQSKRLVMAALDRADRLPPVRLTKEERRMIAEAEADPRPPIPHAQAMRAIRQRARVSR